jgi:hypothetical protein
MTAKPGFMFACPYLLNGHSISMVIRANTWRGFLLTSDPGRARAVKKLCVSVSTSSPSQYQIAMKFPAIVIFLDINITLTSTNIRLQTGNNTIANGNIAVTLTPADIFGHNRSTASSVGDV